MDGGAATSALDATHHAIPLTQKVGQPRRDATCWFGRHIASDLMPPLAQPMCESDRGGLLPHSSEGAADPRLLPFRQTLPLVRSDHHAEAAEGSYVFLGRKTYVALFPVMWGSSCVRLVCLQLA
jgi:hypothetical protein